MRIGPNSQLVSPPWLTAMQRCGPPPSYPNLKIPGLNAPIPEVGWPVLQSACNLLSDRTVTRNFHFRLKKERRRKIPQKISVCSRFFLALLTICRFFLALLTTCSCGDLSMSHTRDFAHFGNFILTFEESFSSRRQKRTLFTV